MPKRLPVLQFTVAPQVWHERPKTRRQCMTAEQVAYEIEERRLAKEDMAGFDLVAVDGDNCARPCPWLGCRYHLAVNVHAQKGSLFVHPKLDAEDPDVGTLPATCALDVAEEHRRSLVEIANYIGVTQEYVHKVAYNAITKARRFERG